MCKLTCMQFLEVYMDKHSPINTKSLSTYKKVLDD